jgi:hypothetical protein
VKRAIAFSNASRLSRAVDCLLAQAPICAIREREAK